MKKLMLLTAVAILTVGATGCRSCDWFRRGAPASAAAMPMAPVYCEPVRRHGGAMRTVQPLRCEFADDGCPAGARGLPGELGPRRSATDTRFREVYCLRPLPAGRAILKAAGCNGR